MFLKLDGIDGGSTDAKHRGEIDIESFSWGASNSGSASHGGGAGAGKVSMQDFSFTAPVSTASPRLLLACASGQHIKQALFSARKFGAKQPDFLKITMSDVLVSSFKQEGISEDDAPTDSVTFNFSKIHISYTTQRPDGGMGGSVDAGWDVKANGKI